MTTVLRPEAPLPGRSAARPRVPGRRAQACKHCGAPIGDERRRDAETCSENCRKAFSKAKRRRDAFTAVTNDACAAAQRDAFTAVTNDTSVACSADGSPAASGDALPLASGDSSTEASGDGSLADAPDACTRDPHDVSRSAGNDASAGSRGDASGPGLDDGSLADTADACARTRHDDTSSEVLSDALPPATPICLWCGGRLPASARADRRTCCRRCKDASLRFGWVAPAFVVMDEPMRFAYADPPYPGRAGLYKGHPDFAGEVDHVALLERLMNEFPQGWALSTHADCLAEVLALCPTGVRVGAYLQEVPPGPVGQELALPRSAWEPVLLYRGRLRPRGAPPVRNWVRATPRRAALPGRVVGTKPPAFCWWLFDCLSAQPHDEFTDLFPGSGAVSRAWRRYAGAEPPDPKLGQSHPSSHPSRSAEAQASGASASDPSPEASVDESPLASGKASPEAARHPSLAAAS